MSERLARSFEESIMKTITKFIFGLPMLALACGSIAFAQVPVTPADSAAKAAAQRTAAVGAVRKWCSLRRDPGGTSP